MKTSHAFLIAAVFIVFPTLHAQSTRERLLLFKEFTAPEERLSMKKDLPFDKAITLFSDFSKKYMNKVIVDPTNTKKSIGIDIENMYWLQAFENILRTNSLWYEEKEEFFQIVSPVDSQKLAARPPSAADSLAKILVKSRDVKISSVFFSVDVVKSAQIGINWDFLYTGDTTRVPRPTSFGGTFSGGVTDPSKQTSGTEGGTTAAQPGFVGKLVPTISFTNINALIGFFQSNQLGDVISSPVVVVTSGQPGRIQVGQDFFIVQKDLSGNLVQQKQSTGIIINVKPEVFEYKGVKFINLDIQAERSTVSPGPIINTSSVKTYSVLLDGEETVIGGLYSTVESNERGGIPFLKDLPWYVLGLRYLFGFDKTTTTKQELIILMKAEIVPTVEERVAQKIKAAETPLEKQRKEFEQEMEKRKPKR